jgi:hypothetical protein
MKVPYCLNHGLLAGVLPLSVCCSAAIIVDTSPGSGAPPSTLGGYTMGAFPSDPTPEGTLINELAPPPAAPVTGNLKFGFGLGAVEHMKVGGFWDTWSHGYTGDVYFNEDSELLMIPLPVGTLAFSFYIQPNLKADFEFKVDSVATLATLTINGNSGASYAGFYTDDVTDPLSWVYIRQTTQDSDGFAVGEFMINGIPEPGAWAGLMALGLGVWALARRRLA